MRSSFSVFFLLLHSCSISEDCFEPVTKRHANSIPNIQGKIYDLLFLLQIKYAFKMKAFDSVVISCASPWKTRGKANFISSLNIVHWYLCSCLSDVDPVERVKKSHDLLPDTKSCQKDTWRTNLRRL